MTIETQLTKVFYEGNGAATEFPLPFPVLKPEHVYLVATDKASGAEAAVSPAAYAVTGCGTENAAVTYPLAGQPAAPGTRLTFYRLLPHVQQTDLENGGAFDAEVIEGSFDNLVMQIQQLREEISRAVKVTISADKTPEELLAELLAAAEAARRAEEYAERAEKAAELAQLGGYVKNIRKTWTATAGSAPGALLNLPAPYYPGRDMLLLMHEGTVCSPLGGFVDGAAEGMQYEEVGDPDQDFPSYQVRVHFPVEAGEQLSVWVIASNAYRVEAMVEAMVAEAAALAARAETAGSAAASSASAAEDAAGAAAEKAEEAGARAESIQALRANAQTLEPGAEATAAYDPATGTLSLGVPRGDTGVGITILGSLNAPEDLPETGQSGDAYLINGDLHVWSENTGTWENVGTIKGPQGDPGLPGAPGRDGRDGEDAMLPGVILLWSGTLGGTDDKHPVNPVTGVADTWYALCDGGTYTAPDGREVATPDLRDRFVLGAGGDRATGDTGGAASVTSAENGNHNHSGATDATTLTGAQMPYHHHSPLGATYLRTDVPTGYGLGTGPLWNTVGNGYINGDGASQPHVHGITGTTWNGSHTHTVATVPPFYALAYIMKL